MGTVTGLSELLPEGDLEHSLLLLITMMIFLVVLLMLLEPLVCVLGVSLYPMPGTPVLPPRRRRG